MEIIQIKILTLRKAIEIESAHAGREFTIEEIELGAGRNRRAIPYTNGFLNYGTEHKAEVIAPGKIKII